MIHDLLSLFTRKQRLRSCVCKSKDFETEWYRRWATRIGQGNPDLYRFGDGFAQTFHKVWEAMEFEGNLPRYRHRKMWEWCAISQVLDQYGQLQPGKRGCGFAVGHEPLPSLFAATGAEILATDLLSDADDTWATTGQKAMLLSQIHWPNLLSEDDFKERVSFEHADMRNLSNLPQNTFDFLWSSCSLEHLGTLEAGIEYIENSIGLLKPGGTAVHTTEFNVSSKDVTLEEGPNVIYRESDIRNLEQRLRSRSAKLNALDFDTGNSPYDLDYDRPPYYSTGRQHIKFELEDFVSTSILLVITRLQ